MRRRQFLASSLAAIGGLGSGITFRATRAEAPALRAGEAAPLTDSQLSHLQHMRNLAALPDGEWRHMGTRDPGQEWLDAYRYQLAFMAYSLGLAAYHYLPAAPCVLREPFDRLIRKMLRREVWGYWKETSRSGPRVDPGLTTLRDGWTDPVTRENIMYSGHLLAMVAMYRMLFDDAKYDSPGSLTFAYDPIFHGLGPETFSYDHASLQERIRAQFDESHGLGVPCEPNNVFVVCNQYPLLAFRLFDAVHGTDLASPALAAYQAAWRRRGGLIDEHGALTWSMMIRQDVTVRSPMPDSAWTLGLLNCWMPEEVRAVTERCARLWLKETSAGTLALRAPNEVIAESAGQPAPGTASPFGSPAFGYVALWLSEIGEHERLAALLRHADRFMEPVIEGGGRFYPRNDRSFDAAGQMTYMDPLTGNALLGYSCINVADGLRAMYERPWRSAHFAAPRIVALAGGDLRRAVHTAGGSGIEFEIRAAVSSGADLEVSFAALQPDAAWSIRTGTQVLASSGGGARSRSASLEVRPDGTATARLAGGNGGRFVLERAAS